MHLYIINIKFKKYSNSFHFIPFYNNSIGFSFFNGFIIQMNIKNRLNASRAAYRKVKNYQTQNSHHLRDLITHQLIKNQQLLKNVEQSFENNQMKLSSQLSEDTNDQGPHYLQLLQQNGLYREFLNGIIGSFSFLELEKLAQWKNTYSKINLSWRKKISGMYAKVKQLQSKLKQQYYGLHYLNLQKEQIKKIRNTRMNEQRKNVQELNKKEEERKMIQQKLTQQGGLSTRRQKKLKEQLENDQKQFLTNLRKMVLSSEELSQISTEQDRKKQDIITKMEKIKQMEITPTQYQLNKQKKTLKQELGSKLLFLLALLKNGFYQHNGLLWIFEELYLFCTQFRQNFDIPQSQAQFTSLKVKTHSRLNKSTLQKLFIKGIYEKLDLKQQNFPYILDTDSKKYLLNIYKNQYLIKLEGKQQKFRSNGVRSSNQPQSEPIFGKKFLNISYKISNGSTEQLDNVLNPEMGELKEDNKKSILIGNLMKKNMRVSEQREINRSGFNNRYSSFDNDEERDNIKSRQNNKASTVPLFGSHCDIKQKNDILPSICLNSNNIRHQDGKSMNFDTKKIYLNTKDILSRWIKNSKKDEYNEQVRGLMNVEEKKSNRNKSEQSQLPDYKIVHQNRIKINLKSRRKSRQSSICNNTDLNNSYLRSSIQKIQIQNRNSHRKRSLPISNFLNNSSRSRRASKQTHQQIQPSQIPQNMTQERTREERRINSLYSPQDRQLVSKLVLGVEYRCKGEVQQIQYMSWH